MRKIALCVAFTTLLAVVGAAPASAGDVTVPDTPGDAANAKGDVSTLQVTYNDANLVLSVVVPSGEAPTAAAWSTDGTETELVFAIDTNADDNPDFFAFYDGSVDGPFILFGNASAEVPCDGAQPGYNASPPTYSVTIPATCMGSPDSVRIASDLTYDPTPNGADDTSDDTAPDEGFTNAVAHGTSGPTVGHERNVRVGVVGADDNQLWAGFGFSAHYIPLGGRLIAAPAVASVQQPGGAQGDGVAIYVGTGTDHQLWVRTESTSWRPLSDGQTYCNDSPAATVRNGQLTVACWGSDNGLWAASGAVATDSVPKLNAWHSIGGILTAGPAIGDVGGGLLYLVVGSGGHVYQSRGAGYSPTQWTCKGHPAIASGQPPTDGTPWFACHGADDGLWAAPWTGSNWGSAFSLGGKVVGGPGVAVNQTSAAFFVQGTDNVVWQRVVRQSDHAPVTNFTSNGGKIKFGVGASSI